jgi:hypothetical protein
MANFEVIKSEKTEKVENTENTKNAWVTIIVIVIIICVFYFFNSGSNSGGDKKAKECALQVITTDNKYYLNSTYTIGKITTRDAVFQSKTGEWYLFKCSYSYNPLNNGGSVMLDRSNEGQVYVGIKLKENNMFNYKFSSSLNDLIKKLD